MASYSRSSHTDGGVNVGGTILNMLSSGFSLEDSVGELPDDSLGAEAKTIRLYLETPTRETAFSDSGNGMTLGVLGDSAVLNNRSEKASNKKRGRFGIGRHTACATLTGAQHPTTTLSKHEDDSDVFAKVGELVTNWPEIIKTNRHTPVPQFISYPNQSKWIKYAIDPKKRGTVTMNPCTEEVFGQLLEKVRTKDITKSLIFNLGRANFEPIEKGLKLSVVVDGVEIPVPAYNPIPLSKIPAENKEVIPMKVYRHKTTKEYRAYFNFKGETSRLRFGVIDKAGRKRTKREKEKPGVDFEFRGNVKVTNAWAKNWDAIHFESIGAEWTGASKEGFSHEVREFLSGRFIKRDDKLIARHSIPPMKAGDKAAYVFHDNMLQMLEFSAEELDDEFGTMLNKGRVLENLIIDAIRESSIWLRYQFAQTLYKREFPNVNAQDDSDDAASVASTRIVPSKAAVSAAVASKPLVPAVKAPTVAQTVVQSVPLAPVKPVIASIVAAAASGTGAVPAVAVAVPAVAVAVPTTVNTQTQVTGHMRSTSKSEKEVLQRVVELAEKIMSSPNIEEKLKTISNTAKSGLTAIIKDIDEIYTFLKQVDVKFEE